MSKRKYSSSSSLDSLDSSLCHSVTLHQNSTILDYVGVRGIPSPISTCVILSATKHSSSQTSEFPLWERLPHPLPVNLPSFRLRSVGQERRTVSETSAMLYSTSSPLLQMPTETYFEQTMSPWHMHSGNWMGCASPTRPSDMSLMSWIRAMLTVQSVSQSISKYLLEVYPIPYIRSATVNKKSIPGLCIHRATI